MVHKNLNIGQNNIENNTFQNEKEEMNQIGNDE